MKSSAPLPEGFTPRPKSERQLTTAPPFAWSQGQPPEHSPALGARDSWALLRDHVPTDLLDADSWQRLEAAVAVSPSPTLLLERTLDSPRIIQFGTPVWPWHMDRVLAREPAQAHCEVLADHVSAWRAVEETIGAPFALYAMWDEPEQAMPPAPQMFLSRVGGEAWQAAVRAFADQLSDAAVAHAWRQCAATRHQGVLGCGVYRGSRSVPTRVTLSSAGKRSFPDHPNWAAVDQIAAITQGVVPIVAVAPGDDPGPTWHVPVVVGYRAQPHELLAPLARALAEFGLVDAQTAQALARPPLLIPVSKAAMLEGQPASLKLRFALERIKVVVSHGQWVSAKACFLVRPVWRSASRVWVEV